MISELIFNNPYDYNEEQNFNSVVNEWEGKINTLENDSADNKVVDAHQETAITTNEELDAHQQSEIDSLEQSVSGYIIPSLIEYAKKVEVASALTKNSQEDRQYTDDRIRLVTSGAPEAFDTLKEIADWISEHSTEAAEMVKAISKNAEDIVSLKINKENINNKVSSLSSASTNTQYPTAKVVYDILNSKVDKVAGKDLFSGSYEDLTDKPTIPVVPTKVSVFENDANYLTEHQSLSAYSTSEEIADTYQLKGNYALKSEVPSAEDFAKKSDVDKNMSQLLTRIEMLEKVQTNLVVASSAEDIENITDPANTNLVLSTQDAIESMTANTAYKSLAIVGGDTEKSITIKANDNIVVDGLTINGSKDANNGKINYFTPNIEIKNIEIKHGSTSYNVFEGSQITSSTDYFTKKFTASNITVDDPQLTHNVANIYTPAENAEIIIKDSYFNLNVANSNVLRMSNYGNSKNVTITFENVDWTYENVNTAAEDWQWAGLMIYQPAGTDVLLSGDTSAISTWTINVKNCRYNGEKVTQNNFGEHNQVIYMYNVNKSSKASSPSLISGLEVNFE